MCYYFATLNRDENLEHPRSEDTLGTLYTWHPRYALGKENDFNHQNRMTHFPAWIFNHFKEFAQLPELKNYTCKAHEIYVNHDYSTFEEIQIFNRRLTAWMKENLYILPVYLKETPYIILRIEPFHYGNSNDHCGFIYTTRTDCEIKGIDFSEATQHLKSEIETLNQYFKGDVWTFTIYSTEDKNFDQKITQHGEDLPANYTYESSCEGCYGFERTQTELQHLLTYYHQTMKARI